MILFDLSNTLYRCYFSLEKRQIIEKEKYGESSIIINANTLLKDVLKDIRNREKKFSDFYGRLILCADSNTNWRKNIFKLYKNNRKQDDRDWDYIMGEFQKIKEILKENSQYVVLEVQDLEADDLIALSVKKSKDNILIISLDKDLNQLLVNDNVKQFSPLTNEFLNESKTNVIEQILTGDATDGVPNIFSDDDHYVKENKVKAKAVTSKIKEYFYNLQNITEESLRDYFKELPNIEQIIQNYKRNKTMVDLNEVPESYIDIFREKLQLAINIANLNKDKHDIWCQEILNEIPDEPEETITIGDLFD